MSFEMGEQAAGSRDQETGYREIEHTADWALEVWAPDPAGLLKSAAQGMYALTMTRLDPSQRVQIQFVLDAPDLESLLVSFLNELLYKGNAGLAFDHFDLSVSDNRLTARLSGGLIVEQVKEIKAVTFHNLAVRQSGKLLQTTVVFDV